jgi:hypothetical protein
MNLYPYILEIASKLLGIPGNTREYPWIRPWVYQWDNNQMAISQIFFKYHERGLKGAKTLRSGQWGHEKGLGQKPHPKSTVAKNQSDHTSIKSIVP